MHSDILCVFLKKALSRGPSLLDALHVFVQEVLRDDGATVRDGRVDKVRIHRIEFQPPAKGCGVAGGNNIVAAIAP